MPSTKSPRPATHDARVEAEKRRRYAALGRTDEHGLRILIARVTAGDAAWLDAMLQRVADLLAVRHSDTPTRDVLRSEALGWLARPAELLTLLLEHTEGVVSTSSTSDDQSRATAFPTALLDTLRTLDPDRLRPKCVLYVHLQEAALTGQTTGVARVEGMSPLARRHHRLTTHAGFRAHQTGPGSYVWRTPHGHYLTVDHTGTHPVPPPLGAVLIDGTALELRLALGLSAAA